MGGLITSSYYTDRYTNSLKLVKYISLEVLSLIISFNLMCRIALLPWYVCLDMISGIVITIPTFFLIKRFQVVSRK